MNGAKLKINRNALHLLIVYYMEFRLVCTWSMTTRTLARFSSLAIYPLDHPHYLLHRLPRGVMIGLRGWGLSVGTHCCWKDRKSLDTLEDLLHEKHTILVLYSTHWRYFITNFKPFLYLGKKLSMDWITMIHTSHLSSMYWQFGASISARLCAYLHKWDAGDDNSVD